MIVVTVFVDLKIEEKECWVTESKGILEFEEEEIEDPEERVKN
jgi:hypothetical protein